MPLTLYLAPYVMVNGTAADEVFPGEDLMSHASFADLGGQHVELLPARTVMSLFGVGGRPGTPGAGGQGEPGSGHNENNIRTGHRFEIDSKGFDGDSGNANPGY
ncbi:MAG TPA: hypothetical protein VIY28_15795 [Pseudonocardiaceae bacterium]